MARRAISSSSLMLLAVTGALIAAGALVAVAPKESPGGGAALAAGFDAQGHRGARGLFPENTWPAFRGALAIGVTTLEMDVGMTADGIVVVHHDPALDPARTRGPGGAWIEGPGPVLFETAFAALAAYDVGRARPGGKYAKRFPDQAAVDGTRIPALSEVLAAAEAQSEQTARYNIEIKTAPGNANTAPPEAIAEALVAVLRAAGVAGRAGVQSFDWRSLKHVQAVAPELPTIYLTAERSWLNNLERGRPGVSPWTAGIDIDDYDGSVPRAIHAAGGAAWSPYYRDLRPADLAEARQLGLKVLVWTVNEPADMASLIERGVDGIITDYPDRLRRVMAENGLTPPPAFGVLPEAAK